jgi:hypothetical protein
MVGGDAEEGVSGIEGVSIYNLGRENPAHKQFAIVIIRKPEPSPAWKQWQQPRKG